MCYVLVSTAGQTPRRDGSSPTAPRCFASGVGVAIMPPSASDYRRPATPAPAAPSTGTAPVHLARSTSLPSAPGCRQTGTAPARRASAPARRCRRKPPRDRRLPPHAHAAAVHQYGKAEHADQTTPCPLADERPELVLPEQPRQQIPAGTG